MLLHADSPVKIRHSLAGRARLYVAGLKHKSVPTITRDWTAEKNSGWITPPKGVPSPTPAEVYTEKIIPLSLGLAAVSAVSSSVIQHPYLTSPMYGTTFFLS